MTDASIFALGAGCGKLQSINLRGCDKVTDAGILYFDAGCGKLQSIDLTGCSKVSDVCLMSLRTRSQFMTCRIIDCEL